MAKQIYAVLKLRDNLSPEMQKAAKKFQKSSAQMAYSLRKTGKSITSVGQSLTNRITKPALTAASAVAGIALKKGWDRMIATDTARGKLLALGNTSKEVSAIMDNALASVQGTSYSLDEAATTAASATAAGIKSGKDLESYLSSVADTAAIAGVGMSEMGSIFNKVATADKAQMDVLNQLSDKGVPVIQWLAEETGKSAAEVQKMASAGQIDLATFRKAVENNVGGAAKAMGSTTIQASLQNIGAAFGRIGANFLGGSDDKSTFAGQLLEQLHSLEAFMTKMEPKAKQWGQKFGEMFTVVIDKVKAIYGWFSKLSPTAKKLLVGFVLGAGPAITIIGKITTGVGSAIRTFRKMKQAVQTLKTFFTVFSFGPAAWIAVAIGAIVTVSILLYRNWDKVKAKAQALKNKIITLWENFKNGHPAIQGICNAINMFRNAIQTAKDKVTGLITKIREFFNYNGKQVTIGAGVDSFSGGNPAQNATGTSYFRGGQTIVGEHGPELLSLPGGSQITPTGRTKEMLGGSKTVNVNVNIAGNVIGNEAYANELGNYISSRIITAMANV